MNKRLPLRSIGLMHHHASPHPLPRVFLPALALVALLFTSCLSIDAAIRIESGDEPRGTVLVEYLIDPAIMEIGVYDEVNPYLNLPIGRYDFEQLARRTEGLELRSWDRRQLDDGRERIRAELVWDNEEALAAYLGPGTRVSQSGLRVPIVPSEPETADQRAPDTVEARRGIGSLLAEVAPEARLRLTLTPSERPSRMSAGELLGDTAVYEILLSDLVLLDGEVTWEVEW